jgi:hypothetical protein
MSRVLAFVALLASASGPGCVLGGSSQEGPCGANPNAEPALEAGTVVDGVDPAAWLSPYWGTYEGTLTWAAGGDTTVTLTSSHDTAQPSVYGECIGGQIDQVYEYGVLVLTTGDGGLLGDTVVTTVGAPLPGVPSGDPPSTAVFADALSAPWPGDLGAHLTVDVSRYAPSSYLLLSLDWPLNTRSPVSASLEFVGSPLQAPSQTDMIQVASMTFP